MNQAITRWGVPHNNSGELKVETTVTALPVGASTEAKQDTIITYIDGLENKLDDVITAVQSIDIDTSAIDLNTDGLETLATAGNASLDSINTKIPAQGAALTASSIPVNIASDQTVAVSMASAPTGTATSANQTTMITHLSNIDTAVNGTLTVDGSAVTQPVSGTFWQATQPISGTVDLGVTDTGYLSSINTAVNSTLIVDGSAVTQPVSGTFWQATQPVSRNHARSSGTITNDSTATALGGSLNNNIQTETIDASNYEHVSVHMITSDAANGMEMQGSNDGSTWHLIDAMYPISFAGGTYTRYWTSTTSNYKHIYRYYRVNNECGSNIPFSSFTYNMST